MSNHLRKPPHSHDAEKAVLGAIFIDTSIIDDVVNSLTQNSFDDKQNRDIFSCITSLQDRDEKVDYISVINELTKKELSVSKEYLIELGNFVPSSANIHYYIKIVKEKEIYRSLISMSTDLSEKAYNEEDEISSLLKKAEEDIFSLAENQQTKSYELVDTILHRAMAQLEMVHNAGGDVTGTSTGYKDLDKLTAGMAEIIIGKQRNGALGDVRLSFLKDYGRFVDPEVHRTEEPHF